MFILELLEPTVAPAQDCSVRQSLRQSETNYCDKRVRWQNQVWAISQHAIAELSAIKEWLILETRELRLPSGNNRLKLSTRLNWAAKTDNEFCKMTDVPIVVFQIITLNSAIEINWIITIALFPITVLRIYLLLDIVAPSAICPLHPRTANGLICDFFKSSKKWYHSSFDQKMHRHKHPFKGVFSSSASLISCIQVYFVEGSFSVFPPLPNRASCVLDISSTLRIMTSLPIRQLEQYFRLLIETKWPIVQSIKVLL